MKTTKTTTTFLLKNPFLIWTFSLLLHSLLLFLVYSIFWASYSQTTLDFLYSFATQNTVFSFSFISWFLVLSLGFSFSAVFAQFFASLSDSNKQIKVLILYILVFFVAFIPLFLWLDKHVVATICVLSGVSLLAINFKKNTLFYINSFVGTFLCLVGLFWSVKGFGWAMAASIPFSLWYLKKENFKNQIPQIVILVSLIILALVWDLIQNQINTNQNTIRFSEEKIKKNVPEWLLDENLMEVNWSKNDFRFWLSGFEGLDFDKNSINKSHFSAKSIQKVSDFLLYYDSVLPVEGNPILEFRYVLLQIALLVFWFLFLGNYNLSRYRLVTYWAVTFLIWTWTKYVSEDTENGFLLALCAYGGLLPLIGANKFKDIISFKIHQKIIFAAIIILIVVELSGSLVIYISKSLSTRKNYVEAKAVLENIYETNSLSDQNIYIDWNAQLNDKTSLPFFTSVTSQFNQRQLNTNLIIPIKNLRTTKNSTSLDLSTTFFIFPTKASKSQIDMLTLYFSEHQNRVIEWKLDWKTEEIEVWTIL